MISELKTKEILTVREMIDLFNAKIGGFNNDIAAIEEKYRKMAEEEKKSLEVALADYKAQLDMWLKMYDSFKKEDIAEVLNTTTVEEETPIAPVEEEVKEDTIVDTLFPDNNAEESEESEVIESVDSSENISGDEASDNAAEEWEEFTEAEAEQKPADEEDDDEWPAVPEEWK